MFTEKSTWEPPVKLLENNVIQTVKCIQKATDRIIGKYLDNKNNDKNGNDNNNLIYNFNQSIKNRDKNNLKPPEKELLKELRNNENIIINPQIKGGGVNSSLDKINYEREAR